MTYYCRLYTKVLLYRYVGIPHQNRIVCVVFEFCLRFFAAAGSLQYCFLGAFDYCLHCCVRAVRCWRATRSGRPLIKHQFVTASTQLSDQYYATHVNPWGGTLEATRTQRTSNRYSFLSASSPFSPAGIRLRSTQISYGGELLIILLVLTC